MKKKESSQTSRDDKNEENEKHKKEGTPLREWLVPIFVSVLILVLSVFSIFSNFDLGVFDIYQALSPSIEQSEDIVMVDIDDKAIDELGGWPWPRTYMADGLQLLSEFGAQSVILDIEYNTPSQPGINRNYLEKTLKNDFDSQFSDLSSNIYDLFSAIKTGNIPLDEADDYINYLVDATNLTKDDLYANAAAVALDSDGYLAESIGFSGITGVAYRLLKEKNTALKDLERASLINKIKLVSKGKAANQNRYIDFLPSLTPMTMAGEWDGYVNVEIDPDGKRRRVKPVETIEGVNYAQLVFEALLAKLGNPEVKIDNHYLTLVGAQYPDGIQDVSIPLDNTGSFLVHWPKTQYAESFHHVSFYYLIQYEQQIDVLYDNLTQLARRDSWQLMTANPVESILAEKDQLNEYLTMVLENPSNDDRDAYFEAKNTWFNDVQTFLDAGYDTAMIDGLTQYAASLPEGDEQKTLWLNELDGLTKSFKSVQTTWDWITENKVLLQNALAGKFCVIGYTGTGTSDLGATPFQTDYPNTGTHACIVNTVLQRDFFEILPMWITYILIIVLPFILFLLIKGRSAVGQNVLGIIFVLICLMVPFAVFFGTGFFVNPVAPVIAVIFTYIGYVVVRFLGEAKEKSFLRKAFGVYMADEIIEELVEDPEKLKLGGENRVMTAMFTDIQKFSTVSEKISATQLVQLLNEYLTGMSDIILDEKGVVDKYEGDAIISFWGAPLPLENHAEHALASALKMKKIEEEMNKHFVASKLAPNPLYTRIGINTGDMVAGNMGTDRKMNYTIMGNTVNLAARLEGVNKMYGTWILTTDFTAKDNMDRFVFRRLDRVRVVGINTPVQLRELVVERSEMTKEQENFLTSFDQALDYFEARDWKNASNLFKDLAAQNPTDGPSKLYLKRSLEYITKPPIDSWDGVFNMTQK